MEDRSGQTPEQGKAPPLLSGEELKQAANALVIETRAKVLKLQRGVPTFCDNTLLALIKQLNQLDNSLPWEESTRRMSGSQGEQLRVALKYLQRFLSRRREGRFVDFDKRFHPTTEGRESESEIGYFEFIMSQGVAECMQWKGMPLFKTAFDFSIYTMMLWNIKPRTIIELGSGTGSSAVWLADLMNTFGLQGHVYSVDLKQPEVKHESVSFIQGNCWTINEVFTDDFLRSAPHPWVFIEDAHVNIYQVLSRFHPFFAEGDYMVVEDSITKREDIGNFLVQHPACYKLDTFYTDFFGRNSTCSHDSIFVRTATQQSESA
jgi:cephalosporin hydroxylase